MIRLASQGSDLYGASERSQGSNNCSGGIRDGLWCDKRYLAAQFVGVALHKGHSRPLGALFERNGCCAGCPAGDQKG